MDIEIGDRRVVLTRAFDAPRERVWRSPVDPAEFQQWWGSGSGVVETMDVRPGGEWSLRQTGQDGAEHRFWGRYVEVDPPARLVMTQGFDAHPAIEVVHALSEEWGRTILIRTMTFPDNAYRDAMMGATLERAADQSYDVLAALLATG